MIHHGSQHEPHPADPIVDALLDEVVGRQTPPDMSGRILQALEARQEQKPATSKESGANGQTDVPLALPLSGVPSVDEVVAPPVQSPGAQSPGALAPSAQPAEEVEPPPVTGVDGKQVEADHRVDVLADGPTLVASASDSAKMRARKAGRKSPPWLVVALSLAVVGCGIGLGVLALRMSDGGTPKVADQKRGDSGDSDTKAVKKKPSGAESRGTHNPAEKHRASPSGDPRTEPAGDLEKPAPRAGSPETDNPEKSPLPPPPFGVAKDDPSADSPGRADPSPEEMDDESVVRFVNYQVRDRQQEFGVQPAPQATDAEWARRLFLRILGRIPTVEELTFFLEDESEGSRERLIERLLYGDKYAAEYARNWTVIWSNILIGRSGGTRPGSLVNREGMQQYLHEALAKNRSYQQIVYDLVTATGSSRPGTPDFNGATNFMLGMYGENATLATAKTTRVFLGMQLQCVQCHDHPMPANDWRQHHFWQMNAFFRQSQPVKEKSGAVKLVDRDFGGEDKKPSYDEAEVYYQGLDGRLKVAYPVFIDGTEISRSGRVAENNRRRKLAELIVRHPQMSRALVNRIWSHFFGFGFTRPIDDMGPHNPPTHPELLDRLSKQFIAHDYDLKKLIKWIALSEPFSISSRIVAGNEKDRPASQHGPLFARYYTRQLGAEQVYQSLMIAASGKRGIRGSLDAADKARMAWLGRFTTPLDNDEGGEISSFDGSIHQQLEMLGGDLVARVTSGKEGTLIHQLLDNKKMTYQERVEHLFLTALSRQPTKKEAQATRKVLQAHSGEEKPALQDVYIALLASNEFILDH